MFVTSVVGAAAARGGAPSPPSLSREVVVTADGAHPCPPRTPSQGPLLLCCSGASFPSAASGCGPPGWARCSRGC